MDLTGLTEKRNSLGTIYYENETGGIVSKCCRRCNEVKTLEDFGILAKGLGGRHGACKVCSAKNKRSYRTEFPEKVAEIERNWRDANPEKVSKKNRKWAKNNPDRCIINAHRHNAKKASLPNTLTLDEWERTLEHFGNACALTGNVNDIQKEHAIAQSAGGGFTFENIIPMTKRLNISKSNRNIFEWFAANQERFNLEKWRFDSLIAWLAERNGMTTAEYKALVYEIYETLYDTDDLKTKDTEERSA